MFLSDGRHFLYLSWSADPAGRGICLGSLDSNQRTLLVKTGLRPGFVAPDLLLYVRDRTLVAQQFSAEPARLLGEPRTLVEHLAIEAIPGQATFAVSPSGVIAYRTRARDIVSELRWVDRHGRVEDTLITGSDSTVSLSRDGRRVALTRVITSSPNEDRMPSNIWLLDLARRIVSRLTLDATSTDENALWSPDDTQIAYATHRGYGGPRLSEVRTQPASGAGVPRVIASGPENFHPIDWAADGRLLLQAYVTTTGGDDLDLWVLDSRPGARPKPLVVGPMAQSQGRFSPDGRWVAYASDESGRQEVYAQPVASAETRVQISSEGGAQPRWRRGGRKIYYVSLEGTVMAVSLTPGADPAPGTPQPLFTEPTLRINNNVYFYGAGAAYDVSADGQRFLVSRLMREPSAGPIDLVLNWR